MEKLRRMQVYLHDGKLWDWSIATATSVFGAQIAWTGRAAALQGLSDSLRSISVLPVSMHGGALVTVGLALSWATGASWRSMRALLILAYLNFYLFASMSAVAAGHMGTAVACGAMSCASIWRVLALTWGGTGHGDRRDDNIRGRNRDDGSGRLHGLPGSST